MKKLKIVIGTPSYTSNMDVNVAVNFSRCLTKWSNKYDVDWLVVQRTFICKARMMIVQEAHKMGADYLFWVDDDALIRTDLLDKLIAHDKDIVITPYPMRKPPYNCGVLRTKNGDIEDQTSYVNLDWEKDLNKGLVEVDGGGTHAMLTKMSVYGPPSLEGEKLTQYALKHPGKIPYPWFVLAPFGGTEDMYFCLMARRVGIKVWCDTDVEAGHVGYPEIITSGHYKVWNRKYGQKTVGEVLETHPKGLSYIDAGDAENLEGTPTIASTEAASVAAPNGSAAGI